MGVGSWSEDEARSKLVALERSGMSLSAWCTQQNISPQRIYYWRDRLRQQPSTLPRLVEVAVQGRSAPVVSGPIEVVWPSGHVLRVPAAVGVAEVLRAVGLGPC